RVREAGSDAAPLRSLPPCGGGTGRGIGSCFQSRLNPPTPTLPHKGGGSAPSERPACPSANTRHPHTTRERTSEPAPFIRKPHHLAYRSSKAFRNRSRQKEASKLRRNGAGSVGLTR